MPDITILGRIAKSGAKTVHLYGGDQMEHCRDVCEKSMVAKNTADWLAAVCDENDAEIAVADCFGEEWMEPYRAAVAVRAALLARNAAQAKEAA